MGAAGVPAAIRFAQEYRRLLSAALF